MPTFRGIADEVEPRLFRPFSRADNPTTRKYGGTGLGLAITRQLARLMRGDVGMDGREHVGTPMWRRDELLLPTEATVA